VEGHARREEEEVHRVQVEAIQALAAAREVPDEIAAREEDEEDVQDGRVLEPIAWR
jgi:hypothetical protein